VGERKRLGGKELHRKMGVGGVEDGEVVIYTAWRGLDGEERETRWVAARGQKLSASCLF
jgi:hypothetical protein